MNSPAAVDLAREIVGFLADPDLDRIRPANDDSALYLSWDGADDPPRPRLSIVVTVTEDVIGEAERLLVAKGIVVEVSNERPAPVVRIVGDDPDDQTIVGPETLPGRWFRVPLNGPTYAGLLAESLRAAEPWQERDDRTGLGAP